MRPGGGLKQLDLLPEETEFVFEAHGSKSEVPDSGYETSEHAGATSSPKAEQSPTAIRTYSSEEAM